eukprot:2560573-Rhodomonas_salina.1
MNRVSSSEGSTGGISAVLLSRARRLLSTNLGVSCQARSCEPRRILLASFILTWCMPVATVVLTWAYAGVLGARFGATHGWGTAGWLWCYGCCGTAGYGCCGTAGGLWRYACCGTEHTVWYYQA